MQVILPVHHRSQRYFFVAKCSGKVVIKEDLFLLGGKEIL